MGHIGFFFMKLPRACRAVSLRPFPNQYEQPYGVFRHSFINSHVMVHRMA